MNSLSPLNKRRLDNFKSKAGQYVEILEYHMAFDLLTFSLNSTVSTDIYKKPACFGAMVLNKNSNDVVAMLASKTILASGGIGQLFLHTTNPKESTGDGIAMAWRAGARCFNLHYIQFHPTALYHPSGRFLISEALRGEGAKLINASGNEFMQDYHELGALAPRDIVSRSIHIQMLKEESDCMFLDITHKNEKWIADRFPTIYKHCLNKGINIAKTDLIISINPDSFPEKECFEKLITTARSDNSIAIVAPKGMANNAVGSTPRLIPND